MKVFQGNDFIALKFYPSFKKQTTSVTTFSGYVLLAAFICRKD